MVSPEVKEEALVVVSSERAPIAPNSSKGNRKITADYSRLACPGSSSRTRSHSPFCGGSRHGDSTSGHHLSNRAKTNGNRPSPFYLRMVYDRDAPVAFDPAACGVLAKKMIMPHSHLLAARDMFDYEQYKRAMSVGVGVSVLF